MAENVKTGDRIRLTHAEGRRNGARLPSTYVVGTEGVVQAANTNRQFGKGSRILFDNFHSDGPVFTHNYKFDIIDSVQPLFGPKPEPVQGPAFSTPFEATGTEVRTAGGERLFEVCGQNSTEAQDKELAQEIVRLLNAAHPNPVTDPFAAPVSKVKVRAVTDNGNDQWFELEPDLWTMGEQHGAGNGSVSYHRAQLRDKANALANVTLPYIRREFGIKSGPVDTFH
jgi:hypothetical protein